MGVGMRQVRQPLLLCGGAPSADAGSVSDSCTFPLSLKMMALPSLHCEATSSNVDKLLSYRSDEKTGKSYPGANTSLLYQWDFLRKDWPEQRAGTRLAGWSVPCLPSSGDSWGWL